MRKLFSVGALLAASALGLWQAQPAEARARVVVVYGHHHHHYYHPYYYHHGRYYYYR